MLNTLIVAKKVKTSIFEASTIPHLVNFWQYATHADITAF